MSRTTVFQARDLQRTGSSDPVSESEARSAYLAMPGRRSLQQLHRNFIEIGRKPPTLRTFGEWSRKRGWVALARVHDAKVAAGATDKIGKVQTETTVRRSIAYRTLADTSAEKALAAVENLKPKVLKASDIRSLIEVSERATKMAEFLEGRATERSETLSRSKLDQMLEEMQREVDERLAAIRDRTTN